MVNFTTIIRNKFLENDTLTVHSLYNEFVDSSASESEQISQKHTVRSVVNNLRKREEIVRFDDGTYKKTDKILDLRGMEEKPAKMKSYVGKKPKKKDRFVEPKYDEGFD